MAPRKPRNHQTTYQRRNDLAKERGFKSYADQRKQFERARKARTFRAALPANELRDGRADIRTNRRSDVRLVRQWEETFYGPDRDDYSVNGPKAKWFVNTLDDYTPDEWRDLYPNGVRETGLGLAA